jgi:hypothetical protein
MNIKRVVTTLILLLAWIIACIFAYQFFQNSSSTEIIQWLIGFAVLIVLGILRANFPAVENFINSVLATYFRFTFWYLLFFLPVLPFYALYDYVTANLPPWLQVLVLFLWGTSLAAAIWVLVLEKNRIRLFHWLRKRVGTSAPLAYAFNLMWIAIFFFSSITFTLVQSGVLRWNEPTGQEVTSGAVMDFYLWHFLDAVPVFKITDTLLWKEPLTYDNSWVGLLLLMFKIIVISPIIGAFLWYWRYLGKEKAVEDRKRHTRKRVPRTYHPKSSVSR